MADLAKRRKQPAAEFALEPVAPKPPARPTKALLASYDRCFQLFFHEPAPIVPGKDGKLAFDLLGVYPLEKLEGWLPVFFQLPDDWIRKSGFTFAIFASNIGKCITASRLPSLNSRTLDEYAAGQRFIDRVQKKPR